MLRRFRGCDKRDIAMLVCIICKEIIEYNGSLKKYAICSSCSSDNLTKEQREVLEKRRIENNREGETK